MSFFTASAERLAAVVCASALALTPTAAVRAQVSTSGFGAAGELVMSALGLLGVPYRYGGSDPSSGVDCSGLVRFAAGAAFGLRLPRQAEAISRTGFAVARAELQPGDLVFFNTLGRPFSHVGIYIGNQQFVHAPARNGQVRIEPMTQTFWRNRFNGARRLDGAPGDEAPAALVTPDVAARWTRPESAPDSTFGLDKPGTISLTWPAKRLLLRGTKTVNATDLQMIMRIIIILFVVLAPVVRLGRVQLDMMRG